jgi:hypothetical protein
LKGANNTYYGFKKALLALMGTDTYIYLSNLVVYDKEYSEELLDLTRDIIEKTYLITQKEWESSN